MLLFCWFAFVNIATTIQAAQTYLDLDWSKMIAIVWPMLTALASWAVSPLVTWPMGVLGLILLARNPKPAPAMPSPVVPQFRRPDEAHSVLRRLSARGMDLAQDISGGFMGYRELEHTKQLRQWANDIAGAARRYLPREHVAALAELRGTMNPNAGNALEFINIHLNRIQEMLDALGDDRVG